MTLKKLPGAVWTASLTVLVARKFNLVTRGMALVDRFTPGDDDHGLDGEPGSMSVISP